MIKRSLNNEDSMMQPTPFSPANNHAPIPFSRQICLLAEKLKEAGLSWQPHVGCFVWDPSGHIAVPSPFPERIYFILNLNHFIRIFGSVEHIVQKLVWLPTWQQARLILKNFSADATEVLKAFETLKVLDEDEDLAVLYSLILKTLKKQQPVT